MKKYFRTSKGYFNFINSYKGEVKRIYLTKKYVVVCL